MVDVLRSVAVRVFEQCGQYYGDRHCLATTQQLLTVVLTIYCELPAPAHHAAPHHNVYCLPSHYNPDNSQGMVFENPRTDSASHFLPFAEISISFQKGTSGVFISHSGICSPAHNGRSMFHEQCQCVMIPAFKVVTRDQMVTPMLFCALFQNPSVTNFIQIKSVMDDFICRTVTNLHLVCHFIDTHSSVVKISTQFPSAISVD
jgi:hypothetical protein